MKTKILIRLSILVLVLSISVRSHTQDIRNVSWGMSVEEALEAEKLEVVKVPEDSTNNSYTMETTLLGRKAFLEYSFVEGKLVKISYTLPA